VGGDTVAVPGAVRDDEAVAEGERLAGLQLELLEERPGEGDRRDRLGAHEPVGRVDRACAVQVLGRVREDERGVRVGLVVLGGEGEPGPLGAHEVRGVRVGAGGEHGAAGEVAGTAPVQAGVAGQLAPGGGRGAEGQGLGAEVGEVDRPVQGPGPGLLVDRVDGEAARLTGPFLPVVRHPGQVLGEGEPAVLDRERGEAVVAHGADAFRQGQVTPAVDIGVAAPEVLAGEMTGRHLQALVPAVVAGAVAGDGAPGQGAHRVGVGLAGLERVGVGAVDVPQDLGAARRGDRDVVAVLVADAEVHARSFGAQSGWSPCMAA
jgi:hypothetical protein